jgi:hypothetical protein
MAEVSEQLCALKIDLGGMDGIQNHSWMTGWIARTETPIHFKHAHQAPAGAKVM